MTEATKRCNPACARSTCVPHSVRLAYDRGPTHFDCLCAAILAKTGSLAEAPNESVIIITGAQGSGKTTHADQLAEFFGMPVIVDEWVPGQPLPPVALVLTTANAIALDDALKLLGA